MCSSLPMEHTSPDFQVANSDRDSTSNHSPSSSSSVYYDSIIQNLQEQIQTLQSQLRESTISHSSPQTSTDDPTPSPTIPGRHTNVQLPRPGHFSGDRTTFRQWLCQVENYLRLYSSSFTSDSMRIGLFTSLLTDSALLWLMPFVECRSPILDNYDKFILELRRAFDDPNRARNSSQRLKKLRQQQFQSFSEYESQFRLLVHDVDWTDSSKKSSSSVKV